MGSVCTAVTSTVLPTVIVSTMAADWEVGRAMSIERVEVSG